MTDTLQPLSIADLRFSHVRDFLADGYAPYGLKKPTFAPGPASDAQIQKISPGPIIFLGVGGGAGLVVENLYDRVFIAVRAIGPQHSYDDAEAYALVTDILLTAVQESTDFGGVRVNGVVRTGGRPQLLEHDSAERYHFTATYIATAATGR